MRYMEPEVLELKVKFSQTICKDIVAFLNSDGGDIVIGVDDDGNILGITKSEF